MMIVFASLFLWPLSVLASGPIKDNPDALSFWLAGGAVAGGLARAIFTHGLLTFYRERKTFNDLIISFIAGWVCPLFFTFPSDWSTATKVIVMAGVAYVSGDILINGVTKALGFYAQKALGTVEAGTVTPK